MTREGQKRINVYIPESLYSLVLNNEYNMTDAVIKGLEKLLEDTGEEKRYTEVEKYQDLLIAELRASNELLKRELEDNKQIHINYMYQVQSLINQRAIAAPETMKAERPAQKAERPAQKNKDIPAQKAEKTLLEKICKNCNQIFFTENKRKETCSNKCRVEYSRERGKKQTTV
jgi:hypothetical protein